MQGARLAIKENNMTGRLVQQNYTIVEAIAERLRAELADKREELALWQGRAEAASRPAQGTALAIPPRRG